MHIYTVSFFGHRQICNPFEVEEKLNKLIKQLLREKNYVEFLVGRDGIFDQLASSAVRSCAKVLDSGNCSLILVLPYMKAEYRNNIESFHNYYDEVEICAEAASAHFKAAIQIRNRSMADRSDLVVCCIEHKSGGAYQAMKYAEKQGKKILHI